MPDIVHRVMIRAPPKRVYDALTTREGLSAWWTTDVRGQGTVGARLGFGFGSATTSMRVEALQPGQVVKWRCMAGPAEWVASTVEFHLEAEGGHTLLRFIQAGHAAGDFFGHCNTKWAFFLLSLKDFLETGTGHPYPNDSDL